MPQLRTLLRNDDGAAAAETVLVAPMLIILMFGSMELGNYFLTQHAMSKQVRDGARFASRLSLADPYVCPGSVFEDADANTKIINVTRTGSVDGTATSRFSAGYWSACSGSANPVTVSIRCVDKTGYGGIYASLADDIPVVTVSANVTYPSLFATLGFDTTGLCTRADSQVPVVGL